MIDAILGSWTPLASWILFASLKGSVIIACVLLLRRMRWLTPQGRYGLWFAVIASLSIPFGVVVSLPDKVQTATTESFQAASRLATTELPAPIIAISDASGTHGSVMSMQSWLILLWLAGAVVLTAAVLYNTTRYSRIKATSTEADAATRALFQQCRDALKVGQRVRLATTTQTASPIVVGYWWPTLLLPAELPTQVTHEQLRLVLLHELAHVARHDILVNWLITCVQIAHWFNPFTWYALRSMRADMELACDATVMRNLSSGEQLAYGDTLIRLSDFTPRRTWLVQNASVVDDHSQLRARIRMISSFKPGKALQSAVAAILLVLVTVVGVTQTSNEANRRTTIGSPTPPPVVIIPTQGNTPPAKAKVPVSAATTKKIDDKPESRFASIQVNYMKAGDLVSIIKSATGMGLLSEQGSVSVVERTNTLLVRDTPERLAVIRQLIAAVDIAPLQMMFEARVAWVDGEFLRDLRARGVRTEEPGPISILEAQYQLDAELAAGAQRQQVEMISAPRLVIANRQKATISQGNAMPATFTQTGDSAVPRKTIGLELAITPTVTPDRHILADISLSMDAIGPVVVMAASGVAVPSIDTRKITTQVLLKAGQTVMLDQLTEKEGGNFSSSSPDPGKDRRLVVFVTPRILDNAAEQTQGR